MQRGGSRRYVVARFEAQLPELLAANGRGHPAPRLEQYLRQYWAVRENGGLRIVGNFVCRSHVEDTRQAWDELYAALGESPGKSIGPVVVDDAGVCKIGASFPAERVEDVEFP